MPRGVAAPPLGEAAGQELSLVQEKAVRRSDAMVMAEDPEDLVIVGEQQDRELAKQLEYLRDQLQG